MDEKFEAIMQNIKERWPNLMERLRVAHHCEADTTGRIEDCPFGGEGHHFEENDD